MNGKGARPAALVCAATAAAAATAFLSACVPANGPLMNPGGDCLSCHGGQTDAPTWTVAGTLYRTPYTPGSPGVQGGRVHITDANGRTVTLRTNQVGNFYTAEGVVFPLSSCAEIDGSTRCMQDPVTTGSCNVCHGPSGEANPSDHARLFPIGAGTPHAGVKCSECHGPRTVAGSHLCAECHIALEPALEKLHLVSTSNPAVTVSPNEFALVSGVCLLCHGDGQVDRTADHPSGFDGAPPHNGATCLVCHDVERRDKPWAVDFLTPPASWPPGSGHGCQHCHAGGVPTGDGGD